MSDVCAWIREKLDGISDEYIKGKGYGDVFESQYLCYLECLVLFQGGKPAGMWQAWIERTTAVTGVAQPMNRLLPDRDKLVAELVSFRSQWMDENKAAIFKPTGPVLVMPTPLEPETPPAVTTTEPPKLGTGRPEKIVVAPPSRVATRKKKDEDSKQGSKFVPVDALELFGI